MNNNEIPVYMFFGFMDSGKTSLIKETLFDNNFADDMLALRINFDIDRHSVWHGGNDGNNLRVDSGKFRRTDLVDGRRDFVGLLFW